MSRKGNCWDNAVAECFFIEVWYNRQRKHALLGYLNPVEFENKEYVSNVA